MRSLLGRAIMRVAEKVMCFFLSFRYCMENGNIAFARFDNRFISAVWGNAVKLALTSCQ